MMWAHGSLDLRLSAKPASSGLLLTRRRVNAARASLNSGGASHCPVLCPVRVSLPSADSQTTPHAVALKMTVSRDKGSVVWVRLGGVSFSLHHGFSWAAGPTSKQACPHGWGGGAGCRRLSPPASPRGEHGDWVPRVSVLNTRSEAASF